jgi:hypothetical protein
MSMRSETWTDDTLDDLTIFDSELFSMLEYIVPLIEHYLVLVTTILHC